MQLFSILSPSLKLNIYTARLFISFLWVKGHFDLVSMPGEKKT